MAGVIAKIPALVKVYVCARKLRDGACGHQLGDHKRDGRCSVRLSPDLHVFDDDPTCPCRGFVSERR